MANLDKIIMSIKSWWYKLIYHFTHDGSINSDDADMQVDEKMTVELLSNLISSAIQSDGDEIELATDILGWISDKLENLLEEGVTYVDVLQGDALCEFFKREHANERNTVIIPEFINVFHNSVVIITMDANENITNCQMIRSNGGLSAKTQAHFKGQPILKIKLPV